MIELLQNQPEIVQKVVDKHFEVCSDYKNRFESSKASGQINLPEILDKEY